MITTTVGSQDGWSGVDAERLADFLTSDTGQRFILKLVDQVPPLLDAGHINKVLIRSGEVRGQTALIQSMQFLAHPPAPREVPADNLPPLELDSAWDDGENTSEVKSAPKE